jgi:hypothetical protein
MLIWDSFVNNSRGISGIQNLHGRGALRSYLLRRHWKQGRLHLIVLVYLLCSSGSLTFFQPLEAHKIFLMVQVDYIEVFPLYENISIILFLLINSTTFATNISLDQ